MAACYSQLLLSVILNPDSTIGSVIAIFANYLGAEHYLLVEKPIENSDPFVVTSDVIGINIPIEWIVDSFDNPRLHSDHQSFTSQDIDHIHQVFSLPVDDHMLIMLINPKSTTPESDVLMLTQSAVRHLHSICPFDIPFAISTIRNFTEKDLFAFSLTKSHPSKLFMITAAYFIQTRLCDTIGIDTRMLFNFLLSVRSHYNNLPYHNWFHALDVTHFIYILYTITHFDRFLTNLEVLAIFLAAICHDIDHDGLNNTFHRNAKTTLAHLAPNLPPLEHHHCCIS
jgi:hypothetical protein